MSLALGLSRSLSTWTSPQIGCTVFSFSCFFFLKSVPLVRNQNTVQLCGASAESRAAPPRLSGASIRTLRSRGGPSRDSPPPPAPADLWSQCLVHRAYLSQNHSPANSPPPPEPTPPHASCAPPPGGRPAPPRHIKPTHTELPLTSQCMAFCTAAYIHLLVSCSVGSRAVSARDADTYRPGVCVCVRVCACVCARAEAAGRPVAPDRAGPAGRANGVFVGTDGAASRASPDSLARNLLKK